MYFAKKVDRPERSFSAAENHGILRAATRNRRGRKADVIRLCGATLCKDLKGVDTGAPLCPCPECVRNAVLALGEVLGE